MKNHKQIAVDSNFVINNYKNYVTERKRADVFVDDSGVSGESIHLPPETYSTPTIGIGAQATSVDINGNYAVVGDPYADVTPGLAGLHHSHGNAFVFKKSGDTWSRIATIQRANASSYGGGSQYGIACAISANGTYAVVSAHRAQIDGKTNAGRIYVFKNDGSDNYTELAQDIVSPNPGTNHYFSLDSVGIDGDHIIVGEPGAGGGKAYIFKKNSGSDTWSLEATLTGDQATGQGASLNANDNFGISVDITSHGDRKYAIVAGSTDDDGATDSGAAWIYELPSGGSWTFKTKLKASDATAQDRIGGTTSSVGSSIAIHEGIAVIGIGVRNSNRGVAYVFERDASTGLWGVEDSSYGSPPHSNPTRSENAKLTPAIALAEDDYFGNSVDIHGTTIVIGAPAADPGRSSAPSNSSGGRPGHIYVFTKVDGTWTEQPSFKTSGTPPTDTTAKNANFGQSVGLSGTNLIVCAPNSDSVRDGSTVLQTGAVYFYNIKISINTVLPGDENPIRSPSFQPPFSLLIPGIHSLRRK